MDAGWVTAIAIGVLGAVGTLYGTINKIRSEREKSVIDQYRQFIDDQREENQKLRERVALHGAHMGDLQAMVVEVYEREIRCSQEFSALWDRLTSSGVSLGAKPEYLGQSHPGLSEFRMKTMAHNSAILKELDNRVPTPRTQPPSIGPRGAAHPATPDSKETT